MRNSNAHPAVSSDAGGKATALEEKDELHGVMSGLLQSRHSHSEPLATDQFAKAMLCKVCKLLVNGGIPRFNAALARSSG